MCTVTSDERLDTNYNYQLCFDIRYLLSRLLIHQLFGDPFQCQHRDLIKKKRDLIKK